MSNTTAAGTVNGSSNPYVLPRKKKMKALTKERFFSVELKSRISLSNVTFVNSGPENVLLEGTLGQLKQAEFAENAILVVTGDKGVLRINLCQKDIKKSVNLEKVTIK
jgi:hypothetical protein